MLCFCSFFYLIKCKIHVVLMEFFIYILEFTWNSLFISKCCVLLWKISENKPKQMKHFAKINGAIYQAKWNWFRAYFKNMTVKILSNYNNYVITTLGCKWKDSSFTPKFRRISALHVLFKRYLSSKFMHNWKQLMKTNKIDSHEEKEIEAVEKKIRRKCNKGSSRSNETKIPKETVNTASRIAVIGSAVRRALGIQFAFNFNKQI